jgi:Zn-dependent peptidase ImmA (M78 family)
MHIDDSNTQQAIESNNKKYSNILFSEDLDGLLESILKKENPTAYDVFLKNYYKYPFKIREYCQELGLTIKEVENVDISGEVDIDKKIINLNIKDAEERKRFTLAHELGHYFFHKNYKKRSTNYYYNEQEREEEQLCNNFAGVLLMPKFAIDRILDIYKTNSTEKGMILYPTLSFLATVFKVSIPAIKTRLSILGYYIPKEEL